MDGDSNQKSGWMFSENQDWEVRAKPTPIKDRELIDASTEIEKEKNASPNVR